MAQPRNIVFKTNTNDDTVTKLTNVNPVLENNGVDIYWWYTPSGGNVAKIKFLPQLFLSLTNVNPVPAIKMFKESDEEIINVIVPEAERELGWSLYYFTVEIGISGILKSQSATKYDVAFQELDVDITSEDYLAEYATASTVVATIQSELEALYPDAEENNYVNVYETSTSDYKSWQYLSGVWTKLEMLLNSQSIRNTQAFQETFKATVASNDSFNMGTPEAQALVLNQIYAELEQLNSIVSSIVGDIGDLMLKADYDPNTYGDTVEKARTIDNGIGGSLAYADIEKTANKNVAGGYAPLDGSGLLPASNLPTGTKVYKGTFGSAGSTTGGDLPSGVQRVGDFYRCDEDDYTSVVAGLTFNIGDTALYTTGGVWVKNDNADAVTSVNNKEGAVVVDQWDINEKYITVLQAGATNNEFYVNAPVSTLVEHMRVFIDVTDIIAGSGAITFSIDNNVTKKPVVNFFDEPFLLENITLTGEHLVGLYIDNKWRVATTDGDFAVITGNGWDGTNIVTLVEQQNVQNVRLGALELAVATPGENILQENNLSAPIVGATGTLQKLSLATLSKPSNDSDILDIDGNNDQIIKLVNTPGFNVTGNESITKTAGNPNAPFVVEFYLFNDADPKIVGNALDTITVESNTIGLTVDRSKSITFSDTEITALGLPLTLVVYYTVISGIGTINSSSLSILSLFSSSGIPIPTTDESVTITNTTLSSQSGVGSKQNIVNQEFVKTNKVQTLTYVSAGKYKADIYTLTDKTKLTLQFPTNLTDPTSEVEVSTDDGVTYYPLVLKDTNNAIINNEIQGQTADVYRDGTNVIVNRIAPLESDTQTYVESTQTELLINPVEGSPLGVQKITGESPINLVAGEAVPNGNSVQFDSITGVKYLDTFTGAFITGDNTTKTITNNSGDVADMMIIPLLSTSQLALTLAESLSRYPVYFEGLKSVENVNVTSTNNNILPVKQWIRSSASGSVGSVYVTPTDGSSTSRIRFDSNITDLVNVLPLKQIKFIFKVGLNYDVELHEYNSSGIFIAASGWIVNGTIRTLQATTNRITVLVRRKDNGVFTPSDFFAEDDLMITYDTTATTWIKHDKSEQTWKTPLRSAIDVADFIDENGQYNQLVGYDLNDVVKNATGWGIAGDYTNSIRFVIDLYSELGYKLVDISSVANVNLIINNDIYPGESVSNLGTDGNRGVGIFNTNTSIYLRVLKSDLSTNDVAGLIAYLQANDVEFLFEFETPEPPVGIDIDGLVKAYDNNTLEITNDNGFAVNVEVKYSYNLPSTVNNTIKELQRVARETDLNEVVIAELLKLIPTTLFEGTSAISTGTSSTGRVTLSESIDNFVDSEIKVTYKLTGASQNEKTLFYKLKGGVIPEPEEWLNSKTASSKIWQTFNILRIDETTIAFYDAEQDTLNSTPAFSIASNGGWEVVKIEGVRRIWKNY